MRIGSDGMVADEAPQVVDVDGGADEDRGVQAVQASWQFLHEGQGPLANSYAYGIRRAIVQAIPDWPQLEVRVRTTAQGVCLESCTQGATGWLVEHIGKVMAVMADMAGRDMAVWPSLLDPGISFKGRWVYKIPCLIVSKSKKKDEWTRWREEELGEALVAEMRDLIAKGLAENLHKWGVVTNEQALGGIRVIDAGTPMPIVPPDGPRGMGRKGVKFIAPWAITGNMSCGHHQLLGYGSTKRGGQLGGSESNAGEGK